MTPMTIPPGRPPLEPLFASSESLWLRVWVATQGLALIVACYVMLAAAGGLRAFVASSVAGRAAITVGLLVVYHLVGFRAHGWMMRRPWAVCLFVPLGWALVVAALAIHSGFSVLVLGAVLQGFIFLPFTWAIVTLTLVVLLALAGILGQSARPDMSPLLSRVVALLATGITFGTVMLYIHRANREAALRSRLLLQLDAAQRDLADRAREAGAQEERQRLARDIHDTLAQGFTSVIRHLEAVELSVDVADPAVRETLRAALPHLANARAVSRVSLAEIRRLVWALRPPQLVEVPVAAAIERIVAHWSTANGVAATCSLDDLPPLQPDADVILLRATQELLSNVARHAQAAQVTVAAHCVDGLVLLSVEDDGRGFPGGETAGIGGMGLAGIRERVRPFGGRVLIDSEPQAGTSITVALPLAVVGAPQT